jgi:glucose/mannose-6-phosphate isomerase
MTNPQHEALKQHTKQVRYALSQYIPHGLRAEQFKNIIIAGMGGSGIGGQLVRNIFASSAPIPIITVAGYELPAFASKDTLLILGSYSGNTEETINILEQGVQRGSSMIGLTSGGKLKEKCEEHQIKCYLLQDGFQPRMALGFSLTFLLLILGELTSREVKTDIEEAIAKIDSDNELINYATQIFEQIKTKATTKFIIITDNDYEALGIRFAQQIQENAKHEAFVHALPEMNHNVIESYYGTLQSVFFFIHSHTHGRIDARFEFLTNLLEVENHKVVHFITENFGIRQVYELNYVLDWLSLMVADHRRVDSLNVPNIASLKDFLDQVSE